MLAKDIPKRWFYGDPGRVRQILANLISNALKFTEKGDIDVTVLLNKTEDEVCHVQISVSDTGQGIPKHDRARIFERFEKAGSGQVGAGLGLSICQSLCDLMEGSIRLDEEYHQGARFVVDLPFKLGEACISKAKAHLKDSSEELDFVNRKVLIVEDNYINRIVLKEILAIYSCEVLVAKDGQEALDVLSQEDVDLVLMDCYMPNMDGFSATKRIREQGNQVPIVALTANAHSEARSVCLKAGMDDFLLKPIQRDCLEKSLKKHLG